MALEILGRDIEKLLGDIRSYKVTVRTKGLDSLQQIFEGRSRELTELLSSELCGAVTWNSLLRCLHEAVKTQAGRLDDPRCTTATKNRTGNYSTVLRKYLDVANDQTQNIAYDVIFEIAFDAFAGAATREHFDLCYVKIIRKHVLQSCHNLATVKISHWSNLLSYLFELFEQNELTKKDLLECYPLLVQCGVKYTHLASDLRKYLPIVVNIVHQEHPIRAQHHVVLTVYEFVKNLAANHRILICEFTETVLSSLIKLNNNYRHETKLELFKVLHLSIVVHHPRVGHDEMPASNAATAVSVPTINYVHDIQKWHKHLRNMLHIVEREIKENGKGVGRSQSSAQLGSTFIAMAADLCAVVFWDDSVWVLPNDEPETKKRSELRKLERLADLIERGDYAWQWATILSKLLTEHPNLIHAEDFQPLLQMLSGLQSKMKYSDQGKVLNELVRILLNVEKRLKNSIPSTSDHWHRIMQIALKNCATSNEAAEQNVELCRIFIESGYIVSYAFIETIVREILSNTIRKSTASVRLMAAIFRNVNMDLLTSANEMKASVINWLSPRVAASGLKQLIENKTDIDIALIAELYVLCVLSKTGKSPKLSFEHHQPTEPHETSVEAIIGDLKRQFSYQFFDELLAVDCDREIDRLSKAEARFDLPEANSIDVVLSEHLCSELAKSLSSDDNFEPTAKTMDDLAIIASSLTTYINILNQFLAYNAFDAARLESSFLYKPIAIKIGQLNSMISGLTHCDDKDQFDVVEKMDSIWRFGLHPLLEQLVFRQECNIQLIEWLALQLQPKLPRYSQPLKRISFAELSAPRKIQLKCLILVARFATLDDENGNRALQVLKTFERDTSCNENLFIMFELAQIILSRKSPEKPVQYVIEFFKGVCGVLFNRPLFLAQLIENIPALTKSVQTSESMQADLLEMVTGLSKTSKTMLSPQLTARFVSTLKYVAQTLPSDLKFVETMLTHFAKFNDIRIQLEAIECLAYIFNHKWIHGQDTGTQLADIHQQLCDAVYSNLPEISSADDMDKKSSDLAIRAQFHCSITASCFCLRKENWFRLFELCCVKFEICRDLIETVVTEICEYFFHKLPVDALRPTIPYLIARWIESNHNIALIPWYFTCSRTLNDFLLDHVESIAVAILRYAPDIHPQFEQKWHFDTLELMLRQHESILINCLAYITPLNVITDDQLYNIGYRTSAMKLTTILMESIPNCLQYFTSLSWEIVEQLLANTWDETHFESMFDTRINYIAEEHVITHKMFIDSIVFIQDNYSNRSNIFENNFTAEPHRLVKLLYSLKLKLQETIFSEEKMLLLFQICILVELISDLLVIYKENDQYRSSVEFFARDLIYFFGNLINTSDGVPQLRLATCKYFLQFCERILPAVAEYFRPHLNFVVSVLVPIIKKNNLESLTACAMELLKFLIVDQGEVLRDAITVLDSFPTQSVFTELCRVQNSAKYGEREFSLVEEIEYFLSIEKRKIEGFIALKEQLSTKKTELQHIFQSIYDVHGFSEDCEKSIIHRLINSLLHIVRGVDSEKAMMAARCLGELGPSDLGTIVLKSDNDSKVYRLCTDLNEATTVLYQTSLEMLNSLLLHKDAIVLRAVANACIHLLKTDIGRNNTDGRSHLNVFNMDGAAESLITLPDKTVVLLPLFETNDQQTITHTVWIKKFTILLLQYFGDECLIEVASLQALFAAALLPPLIKILLSANTTQNNIQLGASVRMFFEKHFNSCEEKGSMDIDQIFRNKMIIKTMLDVAECIRIHNLNVRDRKINLNYLHIAKAANYCDAHFTAILYGEMARMKQFDGVDYDCDDSKAKRIMKESYQSIGEIDAVSAFIDPIENRSEYLHQKKSWDELCLRQDAISATQPANTSAYARTMSDFGLYTSAYGLMQNTNEINYECAWRLGDWSVVDRESERGQQKRNVIFDDCEKFHYFALKCLKDKDESGVKENIEKARNQIIHKIKLSSYECTRNIYKNLTSLHLLQQIEDFCDIQFNVGDASVEMMIKKWNDQDTIAASDFIHREPILAQRIRLFEAAGVRAKRKIEKISVESIPAITLQMVSKCRDEGYLSLASRHLATISTSHLTKDTIAKYRIEDAQLNWALGHQLLAKQLIECVSDKKSATPSYLTSQRILGQYLAEIRSVETKQIIETQENSLKMLENMRANLDKLKDIPADEFHTFHAQHEFETHQLIAKYADREYQQIADYKKSMAFEKKNANVHKNKGQSAEMAKRAKSGEEPTKDEQESKFVLDNTINIDEKEMEAADNDCDYYLEYAIKSYLKCITLETDRYSSNGSHIFRVFSLWLANKSNSIANGTLAKYIDEVPSHKFIALMPQITTHLSSSHDTFYTLIMRIVEKCAIDHPYHVLPQLFALAHANHDIESAKVVKTPRTFTAEALIHELEKQKNLCQVIRQMREMNEILIKLANQTMDKTSKHLPENEPLCKLKDLHLVHCPTVKLSISTDAKYPNNRLATIVRWTTDLMIQDGINAPKRIKCICSNGQTYMQLLKGRDDLRQDAVMQQVFNMMNDMLSHSKTTRKLRLNIRTYVVVPLSQRSGILEWCENTIRFEEYLFDAHRRYFPEDHSPMQCLMRLRAIGEAKKSGKITADKVFTEFIKICEKTHPVLHYFFYEKFYSPGVWFERRLAYAHSLATTSMIGYILGIGDRHGNNILIDQKTAELIHIDFGIAFDQGICLPIPETVPFRLTRDLMAALGSTGIEGVFRQSCEKTMEVLRANKTTIMTIIEVLLHDPLYLWGLTDKKAQKVQESSDRVVVEVQDINGMAERALLRLEEKLNGKYSSRSEANSVPCHVEILIREATNPRNWSQLFYAWKAYL